MGRSWREERNWHDDEHENEEQQREFRRYQKKQFIEEGQRTDHEDDHRNKRR
jgi:hypothetical protein